MSQTSVARGEALVAGAKYIGCADIAGADLADVPEPGHSRQQQAKRDRTAQITEGECEERLNGGRGFKHRRSVSQPEQRRRKTQT
jgi:hypothetical protein